MKGRIVKKISIIFIFAFSFYLSFFVIKLQGIFTKSKTTSVDGTSIHFNKKGRGQPALVFVHGWSCDSHYWKNQVKHFSKDHKVVTIDLAGHGKSGLERKNYTVELYGEDVASVVRKLRLKRVILIGHSMGGWVNLEAARKLQDTVIGLVAVDTYHDFENRPYPKEIVESFLKPFKTDFISSTKTFVQNMFPASADSVMVQKIARDMSLAPQEVAISSSENLFLYDPSLALDELNVPIRCINSDRYPVNLDYNRSLAPDFEVTLMEGLGHFVMMEDPVKFNRHLEQTINELKQLNTK